MKTDLATIPAALKYFRDELNVHLPQLHPVLESELPEPYARLLAHYSDMTGVLESFHKQAIGLHVLSLERSATEVRREVVLRTADGCGVEYGAIRIHLAVFPDGARQEIEACQIPLGTILKNHKIQFSSRPAAFFEVQSDAMLSQLFGLSLNTRLFGRLNQLIGSEDTVLAEVVEILPSQGAIHA